MARARLKKPGKYTDVYEACLFEDCEPKGATTAAPDQDAAAAGGTAAPGTGGEGGGEDSSHAAVPLLPPSGWRVLSRNGAEGEISRYCTGQTRGCARASCIYADATALCGESKSWTTRL